MNLVDIDGVKFFGGLIFVTEFIILPDDVLAVLEGTGWS